jgi:hypothetical protein
MLTSPLQLARLIAGSATSLLPVPHETYGKNFKLRKLRAANQRRLSD